MSNYIDGRTNRPGYANNYQKRYYKEHLLEIKRKKKIFRQKHKEEISKYMKKYKQEHKGRRNAINKERSKNPRYRIDNSIKAGIWSALKKSKAGRKWETLVGYTLQELMKHLESLFESWMTWENYGKWHIDHIKPQSLFNYEKPEDKEFKECWALKNLQPLEATTNMKKYNNFEIKDGHVITDIVRGEHKQLFITI